MNLLNNYYIIKFSLHSAVEVALILKYNIAKTLRIITFLTNENLIIFFMENMLSPCKKPSDLDYFSYRAVISDFKETCSKSKILQRGN